jgi:type I restriction-modification system DNA methylase subunit
VGNASVVGVDEAKLWSMADALRNNMDAAEYKHVVLGLIFLKYISDAFEAKHAELEGQRKPFLFQSANGTMLDPRNIARDNLDHSETDGPASSGNAVQYFSAFP